MCGRSILTANAVAEPTIQVFAAEREAGLGDVIAAGGSVAFASQVVPLTRDGVEIGNALVSPEGAALATNLDQPNLYYFKSILTTTGMNKNDDYFERGRLWQARATVVDKPLNLDHKQDLVMGHLTESRPIDGDGKAIPEDAAEAALPDKYHIYTTGVLYKVCNVPARQKLIDETIAEIEAGKRYVSMECLFKGFDYVLVPKDAATASWDFSQAKLVERGESTAFLTKHLRAYGGKGEWNGQKVGRVLNNMLFQGNGLVLKPANAESLIFSMNDEPLSGAAAKIERLPEELGYATSSGTSATEERDNDMTEAEYKAHVADLTKQLDEAKASVAAKQIEASKAEVATATDKLTKAAEQIATQEKSFAEMAEAKTDLESQVKDLTAKAEANEKARAEAQAKLDEIATAAKNADRLAQVKTAFAVEDEDATRLMDSMGFAGMSDEQFAKAVEAATEYESKKKAAYSAVQNGESKTSSLPAPMGGGSKPAGTVKSAPKSAPTENANVVKTAMAGALDNATVVADETPTPGGDTKADGLEQTQADIMKFFGLDETEVETK